MTIGDPENDKPEARGVTDDRPRTSKTDRILGDA